MKTYTFTKSDFNNSKKNFIDEIIGKSKSTNYSKIIDENQYLFTKPTVCNSYAEDITSDFLKAANFLANYKEPKNKLYDFIIGRTYYLSDNTPIIFYDDEIQIGFDVFKYSDFTSTDFISAIAPKMKNTIIDIYTNARNLTININL